MHIPICKLRRRVCGRVAAILFYGLSSSLPMFGQAGASPGRTPMKNLVEEFLLSEAVRSEDRGELQFTLGGEGLRHRGEDAGLELEYGITDRLQFTFQAPYGVQERLLSDAPVSWSAVSIGGQYQFVRSDRPFALAFALAGGVPVNSRGARDVEPEILLAKGAGKSQVHFSAGGQFGTNPDEWNANAAWVRPARGRWLTTFEMNGRRIGGEEGLYFTPGIYGHWFPRFGKRIEAGAGIPAGIGPAASHLGVAAKVTVEFGGDSD